jgi:toxin ParE1/3/4
MLRRVIRRPAVNRDLIDCFVHIGEDNEESAMRFLRSAEETFHELARMPGMGVAVSFSDLQNLSLRRWRIRGFENFLIFYRPIDNGIEVIRVLHGAREIERIFE